MIIQLLIWNFERVLVSKGIMIDTSTLKLLNIII